MNRLRAHLGPLWPYLVLVAIPTAAFVLPDLFGGRLLITGDNLQQNFPLHVLVGSMLRHGELPFWNQYIFSGTPLMADFNAGAFYPLVGLFVILPDRAAWIATEVVLFSAIAVGMYVFLRALKLSTLACVIAAATFAFAGPVLSEVNHVDMTEGYVAIPWMLLAVLHIVRDGRWRWSILLGVAFATVILGGAPEAMLDEALLVIVFAAFSAGLSGQRWWRVLTRCAAGAALALSLAAIQWLPGLEAIRSSQRASGVIAAAGSFPTPFSIFSLVPYIDGGYGHLGEVQFFSQYNLPEVGIYLGILPVIAALTVWHRRWPSRIAARDRYTWYGVGIVGYLLALGSNTPLEHLFNSLPLYGHQRLQSRNMVTVATALCVLLAAWIDRTDAPRVNDPMRLVRPDHGSHPVRPRGGAVRLGAGGARVAGPRLRGCDRDLRHHLDGARGDADRAGILRRRCGARLDPPSAAYRPVDGAGRGLRRARPRADRRHQSADPDAPERPAHRDDADRAAGGRPSGPRRPHGQLRPPDLRQLSGQPPGCTGPQHHSGAAVDLGLRVHRQRQLRVGDAHPRAGRPRHRAAGVGHASTGSTSARS